MDGSARFEGPLRRLWGTRLDDVGRLLRTPSDPLPVSPASDRSVWDRRTGSADRASVADLCARAEQDLGTPWPQALASGYARFWRDGDRDAYEQVVFARQRRLTRAAVAAAVTLEDRWVDEVADGVTVLCEQSSWCWPAHDDTRRAHGAVVPTVDDPFVDLGAGEVVGQLAWVDHLLGEQLDARVPGVRARIRHEGRVRVLDPFERRRDWHWLGLDGHVHNWSPWIHGNLLVAALRLVDDPATRARLVSLVVEGLDRYVAVLPADGAIDEGYAYWWNGACRALEALDLLAHATGGALDATAVPQLRATVAFPHRMHLGRDWYLNLADGPARPPRDQPWDALHRAARRAGDDDARRHSAAHRHPGQPVATEREGLGRLLRAVTDEEWAAATAEQSPLPRDSWFPSTQVLLARQSGGTTRGLTLAVKGGHNGENHNHNDVGSVVVAVDGVPVLVDAGRPTYTAQTFGPDRYSIWTMQSGWHNVPDVLGTEQRAGREWHADHVMPVLAGSRPGLTLELATAYPCEEARSWVRSALLDRDTGSVTVTDTWVVDGLPAAGSTLNLLVAGELTLEDGGAVVVPLERARSVRLRWDGVVGVQWEVRELDDPMLSTVWGRSLTRVRLSLPAGSGTATVTVELVP